LGIVYAKDKDYGQAVSELQQAIKLDPQRSDAHYRLAEVYRAQGKRELAQNELNKVSQIHEQERDKLLREFTPPASAAPEK
jgi:Tfp pilus assembly protein PilF